MSLLIDEGLNVLFIEEKKSYGLVMEWTQIINLQVNVRVHVLYNVLRSTPKYKCAIARAEGGRIRVLQIV